MALTKPLPATATEGEQGHRCQLFSFATGGKGGPCGKPAHWRMDLVCDRCGPRAGYVCDEHLPLIRERIGMRYARCGYASRRCPGFLVSVVFVELI